MSGAGDVPCVVCGTATPREEMFGLEPDLRCPSCAQGLRERNSPTTVRRTSVSWRPTSLQPDGRATGAILALAVVLFVGMRLNSPVKDLLGKSLEILGYDTAHGFEPVTRPGPWRFPLWAFLHGSITHLLMNGFALWQVGRWIEWGWGRRALTLLLVGTAPAGVAAGWLVNGVPTIGLSGGLFALDGWLIAQRRTHAFATAIVNRVFINSLLASSVLLVILTEVGSWRVSHVGHAAGFLWGLAAGFSAGSRRPLVGYALLAAATAALLILPSYVAPLGWSVSLFRR